MEKMKFTSFEDYQNKHFGEVGTPKRDKFEKKVDDALNAYRIGEAIRQARKANNLSQEQLGERIGVHKAQISRLERGRGITFATMARIFKAMNVSASLEMTGIGKIALW